jgi:hypothetical protein
MILRHGQRTRTQPLWDGSTRQEQVSGVVWLILPSSGFITGKGIRQTHPNDRTGGRPAVHAVIIHRGTHVHHALGSHLQRGNCEGSADTGKAQVPLARSRRPTSRMLGRWSRTTTMC